MFDWTHHCGLGVQKDHLNVDLDLRLGQGVTGVGMSVLADHEDRGTHSPVT